MHWTRPSTQRCDPLCALAYEPGQAPKSKWLDNSGWPAPCVFASPRAGCCQQAARVGFVKLCHLILLLLQERLAKAGLKDTEEEELWREELDEGVKELEK